MVNFGLNSASILGIFLAVAGAGLYFLRSVRPELSRDHDIFFAAIGLLCGFILLFQGWRLDPILQFGQVLLTGSAIFFAVESIRLRGVATEQAKQRSDRFVDEERTVSKVYRAELDELEPMEEEPPRRRIRGTLDSRSSRESYEDEPRRRSSSRGGTERPAPGGERGGERDSYGGQATRSRKSRTRPESRRPARSEDEWGSSNGVDDLDSSANTGRKARRPSSSDIPDLDNRDPDTATKPRKRRPPEDSVSRRNSSRNSSEDEATPADYVDYKPVDYPEDEGDNSRNFDKDDF
jgi:hypothetical protein